MKTLIITLITLFVVFECSGQKIISLHTGELKWGTSYTAVPMVTEMSDGSIEVSGDSITAIKLLLKEIKRRDSVHQKEIDWQYSRYMKLVHAVLADQKYRDKIWNDLQKDIKKLTTNK